MKKNNKPLKKGWFNIEEMTVQFGGAMSKPEFIFTAKAIKCPTYKRMVKERESLGGGWYGSMEVVEKIYDKYYLVIKDGVCIGVMYSPYVISGIKSDLHPINEKTPNEIMIFFNSLKIPYQFYDSNKVPFIIGKTSYDEWLGKAE